MTKRRAVQIFIVVGVMVLTGFISIFCMLTAITLFILNIYIRERHMRKRFNPWKDTRRNFDAIVIGERYDLRRLHLNGSKILKEITGNRAGRRNITGCDLADHAVGKTAALTERGIECHTAETAAF